MTSLFGRSTLYDMLTCLIPGYCILFFLHFAQFIREIVNIDSTSIVITLFVLSYIVGLIYKHLVFYFTDNEFRNNPVNIRKAYFLAEIQHKKPIPLTDNGLLETYYMAYYNAVKENGNSSIPTLEAQIAFLREIPILIILAPCLFRCSHSKNWRRILFVVFVCHIQNCPSCSRKYSTKASQTSLGR